MTAQRDLSNVIQNDLCIGCGACVAAEPGLALRLSAEKMMYEPSGPGGEAAASVCPSVEADTNRLQAMRFPGAPSTPVGVVEAILLAQSTDRERNLRSSSGGIIKELLLHYLESGQVDGAIALSHQGGLLFQPALVTDARQVDALPGSIYHNVPFDAALRLLKDNDGRFALVATPCQLEGIYKYVFGVEPALAGRIGVAIGLICGWTYTHHAVRAICHFKGAEFAGIRDIAFRGGDAVGSLRIQLPQKTLEVNRRRDFDYIVSFDRSFNIPRCHLCVNHVNFLADIVVGDAWLRRTARTRTGVSIVICRTEDSLKLVHDLEGRGRIRLAEAGEADVVESQGRDFTCGDFPYAYADYLARIGKYRPELTGPNRGAARPVSRRRVEHFRRENAHKVRLQRHGRYRRLWWRKVAADLPRYAWRSLRKRAGRPSAPGQEGGVGAGVPGEFS